MQYRPYQSEYINNLQIGKSNLVISTMRSGKSVIIKGMIDTHFPTGKVLVLVGIRHVILQLAEYYDESEFTFILSGKPFDHSKHIHLGTYQTLQRRAIDLSEYDLICIDEVHMRFNTAIVKEIRALPCTRAYFTGTPLTNRNTFLSDEFDNVMEYTNIKQMIDDGYLAPTQFMSIGNMLSNESDMQVQNGDYRNEDIDRVIDRTALINWIIADDSKYNWSTQHKTIMYTNSIATTERIVNQFNSPNVRAIHSKLSKSDMEATMQWFEQTANGIIVNCRMLTVGVDIPTADRIVYLLPTMIHSLFLQSVFRASTKLGDKQAIVYDYSGMLNKLNPFSNEWKKHKLSCRDKCIKQYPTDLLAQYFCMESCKSNPILVPCTGKLPVSLIDNPFISNFMVHEGKPCGISRPVWEFTYKQTDGQFGLLTKWSKCTCGCITSYDVTTFTAKPEMVQVYTHEKPSNTAIVIFNKELHRAFVIFDKLKESVYKQGFYNSSSDIMAEAYKYFANSEFSIVSNHNLSNLPKLTVLHSLINAIKYIDWKNELNNTTFIKHLIRLRLSEVCDEWAIKPGYIHYTMQLITSDNEKQILTFINRSDLDRSKIVKFFKKFQD